MVKDICSKNTTIKYLLTAFRNVVSMLIKEQYITSYQLLSIKQDRVLAN